MLKATILMQRCHKALTGSLLKSAYETDLVVENCTDWDILRDAIQPVHYYAIEVLISDEMRF